MSLPPKDPFCDMEQIKDRLFYRTGHFYAVYDIRPVVRGHVLFISRRHVEDIIDFSEAERKDMHDAFFYVIPRLLSIYCPEERSYDLTAQIGEYSGRTINHFHMHMIPRTKADGYQKRSARIYADVALNRSSFSAADVEKEVKLLRKEFRYKPTQ